MRNRDFVNDWWDKHGVIGGEIGLLHCVVSYPTPPEEAGLSLMSRLKIDGVTPGYSDHTFGIRAAALAVAAGARIIEKHFTINRRYSDFRDRQLSADPEDLKQLVEEIAEVELFLGNPRDLIQQCEAGSENAVRRSVAADREMGAGETVGWGDLCWTRPRVGLKPGEESLICRRKLNRSWGSIHTQSF